ncbi:uncharacterized protein LOC125041107 isoform X2 [Penaeus chinensis]|nr:uncharacterized protein LOC125041107 isoform X2 [Penaeus chinensis]
MLVEQSDGRFQCACGETLKKASLTGHLKSNRHLEEFTVQAALEKNIFVEIENEEYQCACKRKLKKASLRGHLTTKIHLAEVHARKLWMKSGKDKETEDPRSNNTVQEEEIVVESDDNITRCHSCGKRFSNKEYLERHALDSKCRKKINRKRENVQSMTETPITPYTIRSDPPGHVYVFNNDFQGQELERRGAKQDSCNLKETFTRMGYEVFLLENLSAQKTMAAVDRIRSDPALANVDVLVMVFLSHGKRAFKFRAQDRETLDLRKIRRNFTHSLCPNLKGKAENFLHEFLPRTGPPNTDGRHRAHEGHGDNSRGPGRDRSAAQHPLRHLLRYGSVLSAAEIRSPQKSAGNLPRAGKENEGNEGDFASVGGRCFPRFLFHAKSASRVRMPCKANLICISIEIYRHYCCTYPKSSNNMLYMLMALSLHPFYHTTNRHDTVSNVNSCSRDISPFIYFPCLARNP